MAYRDFAPPPYETLAVGVREARSRLAEPPLTPIERDAISASLRDPVWSLAPSGRVRRTLHWIFDTRRPNPLANSRLEALRRFAVLVRRLGDRLDDAEVERLALAGYSPSQIHTARRLVTSATAGSRRRVAR